MIAPEKGGATQRTFRGLEAPLLLWRRRASTRTPRPLPRFHPPNGSGCCDHEGRSAFQRLAGVAVTWTRRGRFKSKCTVGRHVYKPKPCSANAVLQDTRMWSGCMHISDAYTLTFPTINISQFSRYFANSLLCVPGEIVNELL